MEDREETLDSLHELCNNTKRKRTILPTNPFHQWRRNLVFLLETRRCALVVAVLAFFLGSSAGSSFAFLFLLDDRIGFANASSYAMRSLYQRGSTTRHRTLALAPPASCMSSARSQSSFFHFFLSNIRKRTGQVSGHSSCPKHLGVPSL